MLFKLASLLFMSVLRREMDVSAFEGVEKSFNWKFSFYYHLNYDIPFIHNKPDEYISIVHGKGAFT